MRFSITVAIMSLSMTGFLMADQAWATIRKQTNIEAQELAPALRALAKQRDVQLVYRSEIVGTRQTSGASGDLTVEEALTELLHGTGLTFQYLEAGITIVPAGPQAAKKVGLRKLGMIEVASASAAAPAGVEAQQQSSAAAADPRDTKIEEIVVTAQKRAERLVDAPLSIGVLSGEQLDRSSSRSVTDVLSQVGGVSVSETQPGIVQIAIRGVISGTDSGTSTTGYYMDEVPFSDVRSGRLPDSNAFDLARVEVLRGSQGTLYGANALSGVVRVLTNDANLDAFEAKGRVRVSETGRDGDNNNDYDFAVNVPLIPGKLAVRAVAGYSNQSGFLGSNFAADGGTQINGYQAQSYRLKLNYQASENLNFKLGYVRGVIEVDAPSVAQSNFLTSYPASQTDRRPMDTYNLLADYRWSNVSLLSSSSYLTRSYDNYGGLFLGPFLRVISKGKLKSYAQEFRLSSHLDGPWQWSAGAFYKDAEEVESQDARANPTHPFAAFFTGVYHIVEHSKSYAAFAETVRSFADGRFELTGGLRYFNDDLVTTQQGAFALGAALAPYKKLQSDAVTGRLILAFKPEKDQTYYASIATGFRPGLNQPPATAVPHPEFGPLDPDKLTTYELGAKGIAFGGALSYETAVYYLDWTDIQQNIRVIEGFNARTNAGKAAGVGVDQSITYRPSRALSLQASIGWNDLKLKQNIVTSVVDQGVTRVVTLFREGDRVNDSPTWTGSVGGSYRVATPVAAADLVVESIYTYGSSRPNRFLSAPIVDQSFSDSIRTLKAGVGLESERWGITLFGDNLLNEDGAVTPPQSFANFDATRLRPRTIGLQGTFNY